MYKVSIIIPSFNRISFLEECVHSLKNQTFKDFEIIIVDDGSYAEVVEQIQNQCKKSENCQLIPRTTLSRGASTCRNIGLKYAQGKYIIFLDSDDILAPHCLEQRAQIMDNNPELDFAVFPMLIFSKKPGDTNLLWNRQTEEPDLNRFLRLDSVWQTTGPIWRRHSLEKIGGFDESLACWQDIDIHLKALFAGLKYKVFDELQPDSYYRQHSQSSISQGNLNSTSKIQSRLRLFYWAYQKLDEIKAGTQAYQAIKEMCLGILVSMGSTLQTKWLFKALKFLHIRTLLTSKEKGMVLGHAFIYIVRLYKFKPLLKYHLLRLNKHFTPINVGKTAN